MKSTIIFILIFMFPPCYAHKCIHDSIQQQIQIHQDLHNHRNLQTQEFQPIRIQADYSNLDSIDTQVKQKIISIVQSAITILSELLSIDTPMQKLSLSEQQAQLFKDQLGIGVPPNHISEDNIGLTNCDLLIYVCQKSLGVNSNTLASASAYLIGTNRRPIVGYIQFNYDYISNPTQDNSYLFQRQVRVALHEITHILGFSANLFQHYYDRGITYDKIKELENNIVKDVSKTYKFAMIRNKNMLFIISDKVRQEGINYYGCKDLFGIFITSYNIQYIGVPLEDGGGGGSQYSHWDQTTIGDDYMKPQNVGEMKISRITLALLEDTGWYKPNYDLAEDMVQGKNQNCDFVYNACHSNIKYKEFCYTLNTNTIDFTQRSLAQCTTSTFSDCLIAPLIINYDCQNQYSTLTNWIPYTQEVFGTSSLQFFSNIAPQAISQDKNIRCYQSQCNEDQTQMTISIADQQIICTKEDYNKQKSIEGYSGILLCPDLTKCQFINSECPKYCSYEGFCLNRACKCFKGAHLQDGSCECDQPNCEVCRFVESDLNKLKCQKCKSGFSMMDQKCCPNNCKVCDEQSRCEECSDQFLLLKNELRECVEKCPDRSYQVDDECIPCPNYCKTCNHERHCLECLIDDSYLRIEDVNIENYADSQNCIHSQDCTNGYILLQDKCYKCHKNCLTCTGYQQDNCLTCPQSLYYLDHQCLQSCPLFSIQQSNQCLLCQGYILVDIQQCLDHCPHSYYQQEIDEASKIYYSDTLNKAFCYPCFTNCKLCNGPNIEDCQQCNDDYLLLNNSQCIPSAKCNSKLQRSQINQYECTKCHPNCLTCDGQSESNCLTCQKNLKYYQKLKQCSSQCPTQTIESNNECHICLGKIYKQECILTKCPEDSYFESISEEQLTVIQENNFNIDDLQIGVCIICPIKNCIKCKDEVCVECLSPYISIGKKCITSQECYDQGNYVNEKNECKDCHISCQTCKGPQAQDCLKCSNNYYFLEEETTCMPTCPLISIKREKKCEVCYGALNQENNICYSDYKCPDGYYLEIAKNIHQLTKTQQESEQQAGLCKKCNPNCYRCNEKHCLQCEDGEYLNEEHKCKQCYKRCKTCEKSRGNCLSCFDNHQLEKKENKQICIPICQEGEYLDYFYECNKCPVNCQKCFNSLICLQCSGKYQLIKGKCQKDCSNGYYFGDIDCQKCPEKCLICRYNQCYICEKDYKLNIDGGCIDNSAQVDQSYIDYGYAQTQWSIMMISWIWMNLLI